MIQTIQRVLAAAALTLSLGLTSYAQTASTPNGSYQPVENWAKLPISRPWGAVTAVAVDSRDNIWVLDRCASDSCVGSKEAPILKFDKSGNLLASFGAGLFVYPHGLFVDKDDNIWVADADGQDGKGQQVMKFNPSGKLLLVLGKRGVAGAGNDTFTRPSAVVVARNGDIFVADGHMPNRGFDGSVPSNGRLMKFSKDGKFIKSWGKRGTGPGEMDDLHALAIDSRDRLFVADRGNKRIQIFSANGELLDQWKQFPRPSGIFVGKDDKVYVADDSAETGGVHVADAKTGSISMFIPDPGVQGTVGVVADSSGNLYGAEIVRKMVKKFAKP